MVVAAKRYHSPKDYLDAAKSPETPSPELEALARSAYDFVQIAVARHPHVTPEILASLVPAKVESWNEQELAAVLAQDPKTPVEALHKLAEKLVPVLNHGRGNDNGLRAGVNLCCNANAPLETIKKVLNPDEVSVHLRKAVARETERKDVLKLLLGDRSEAVRKRAHERLEKINRADADMPTHV